MKTILRKNIRRSICAHRQRLTPDQYRLLANTISEKLTQLTIFTQARNIAFYFSHKGEVDTTNLWLKSFKLGKKCYFPKIINMTNGHMIFVAYQPGDSLHPNKFGIHEPNQQSDNPIDTTQLDLVVVPIVAFNSQGYRLGMGSGYYDRSFSFLRDKRIRKPTLVGIAYEFQKRNDIPIEPWDVALCAVLTEKKIYWREPS